MKIIKQSLLFSVCTLFLCACGFHLRGSIELSAEVTPLYMEQTGIDKDLNRELRALLAQTGNGMLTQSKSDAKVILTIVSANKKTRVVAVDDRGRARQYELSYNVTYSITGDNIPQSGSDGSDVIRLKREVIFDPDSVLAIEHEADNLYSDMRKDSARLILQRLRALGEQTHGQ